VPRGGKFYTLRFPIDDHIDEQLFVSVVSADNVRYRIGSRASLAAVVGPRKTRREIDRGLVSFLNAVSVVKRHNEGQEARARSRQDFSGAFQLRIRS